MPASALGIEWTTAGLLADLARTFPLTGLVTQVQYDKENSCMPEILVL
jgi:hypothetical protein